MIMEDDGARTMIDRKSSIEKEPRTLSILQIQRAREAALYVVNTRSVGEAMEIFLEGLKPVASAAGVNGDIITMDWTGEDERFEDHLLVPATRGTVLAPF